MKYFSIFILILSFTSCATRPKPPASPIDALYGEYRASYDSVWNASSKALSKYKITFSNKDAGLIQTDFLTGYSRTEFYTSGGEKFQKEIKWKLQLKLIPTTTQKGTSLVKVRVAKETYISPGFLEDWKPTETDYLTEKALLYRIGRIVYLDSKVEKLTTPQQGAPTQAPTPEK
ncbi:MAG: hypothetical protein HYY62_09030 [Deltaproteobacteria bacterium]|nr:hypothetical protein [Deltaproteobacteria bacterium]